MSPVSREPRRNPHIPKRNLYAADLKARRDQPVSCMPLNVSQVLASRLSKSLQRRESICRESLENIFVKDAGIDSLARSGGREKSFEHCGNIFDNLQREEPRQDLTGCFINCVFVP
jgi:hypothetical protein